jgi:hypothetical protein
VIKYKTAKSWYKDKIYEQTQFTNTEQKIFKKKQPQPQSKNIVVNTGTPKGQMVPPTLVGPDVLPIVKSCK